MCLWYDWFLWCVTFSVSVFPQFVFLCVCKSVTYRNFVFILCIILYSMLCSVSLITVMCLCIYFCIYLCSYIEIFEPANFPILCLFMYILWSKYALFLVCIYGYKSHDIPYNVYFYVMYLCLYSNVCIFSKCVLLSVLILGFFSLLCVPFFFMFCTRILNRIFLCVL